MKAWDSHKGVTLFKRLHTDDAKRLVLLGKWIVGMDMSDGKRSDVGAGKWRMSRS